MRLLQRKNNPKRHAREKILINRLEWKASANAGVSTDTKRGCFINIHLSEFRDHDDPFVYDLEIQDSEVPDLIATLTERLAKAKEIYQRLTKLRPDDFTVWNNLACLKDISPEQSLEYSQKAVELMRRTGRQEPYVLDTHGWNLVQANRIDEGIANLNDAWSIEQFPDLAYHLGVANMRKSNLDQADKYLQQAMQLFQTRLEAKAITSMKLQDDIVAAQKELRELRTRDAAQNN